MSLELSRPAGPAEPPGRSCRPPRVLVVVVSGGRRPEALDRALGSALDQRDEPADVLLVAPPDAAAARQAAGRVGIVVVDDPGRGPAAALNAGLGAATAPHRYLTWLGDGDALLPGAVATAVRVLERDPHTVVAFGDCRYLAPDGDYLFTTHAGSRAAQRLGLGLGRPALPATLLRLEAVTAVGGLDESLLHVADLDLLLRLRGRGRFASIGRTLATSCWDPAWATGPRRVAALAEARRVRRAHLPPAVGAVLDAVRPPGRLAVRLSGRALPAGALRAVGWPPASSAPSAPGPAEGRPSRAGVL